VEKSEKREGDSEGEKKYNGLRGRRKEPYFYEERKNWPAGGGGNSGSVRALIKKGGYHESKKGGEKGRSLKTVLPTGRSRRKGRSQVLTTRELN